MKHHLLLTEIIEGLLKVIKEIPTLFRLHYYIINVGFDVPPNLIFQDDVHTLLVCSSPVLQPEGHLGVTENPERRYERCFLFVVCGEANLTIT
jgi:hypothetical protein